MIRTKGADHWIELHKLVEGHKLTDKQIAEKLGGSVKVRTIRAWRQHQNPTPLWAIRLLRANLPKDDP